MKLGTSTKVPPYGASSHCPVPDPTCYNFLFRDHFAHETRDIQARFGKCELPWRNATTVCANA
jgi:hypothetical protein